MAVDGIKAVLDKAGYELALLERYTENNYLMQLLMQMPSSYVVTLLMPKLFRLLKILRLLYAGAGFDNVDLEAATKAGVCVMNTRDKTPTQ